MLKSEKGYLFAGTGSDERKPERLIAKIQKANSRAKRFRFPKNFDYRSFCVEGVRVETLENKLQPPTKALILLHGGNFLRASDDFYRSHMLFFAKKLGVKVFMPDYSVMPNNPSPKQNEEIKIIWNFVTETFAPSDVVLFGVDAGANLALTLSEELSKQKMLTAKAQVLVSPWIDMSASGDSYYDKFYLDKVLGNYVVLGPDLPTEIKKTPFYLHAKDKASTNPSVSPLFGPLWSLPPTYICVGDYSVLQSDAERLFEGLKKAGVECEYECPDGEIGEYVMFYASRKKSRQSMNKIIEWIKNALA